MLRLVATSVRRTVCLSRVPRVSASAAFQKNIGFSSWSVLGAAETPTKAPSSPSPPPENSETKRPAHQWTQEGDDRLRVLGARVGKDMSWQEVADQMQLPLATVYRRFKRLYDPRLEQLLEDKDRMRQLDHLMAYQLHWQEIGDILGQLPLIIVEAAYKQSRKCLPPFHFRQLVQATEDPRYQLDSFAALSSQEENGSLQDTMEYLGTKVQRWPEFDWKAISKQVFHSQYDPAVLRQEYFRHQVASLRFSPKNHAQLRKAVLGQLKAMGNEDESRIDWETVHKDIGSICSPVYCRRVWARQRERSYTIFPWQEDEMIIFWQQYIRQGQQWHEIAKHLPNRTKDDCRQDFQKLAKTAVKLGEPFQQRVIKGLSDGEATDLSIRFPTFFFAATSWTPQLDEQLLKHYLEAKANLEKGWVTNLWEAVSTRLDAGASAFHCLRRFQKLERESQQRASTIQADQGTRKEEGDGKDGEGGKKKSKAPRIPLSNEEKAKLTTLVQAVNPTRRAGWDEVEANMVGRPASSLRILWSEIQRDMILDDPQGRETLERTVLEHGGRMWHAIGDALTLWLYRQNPTKIPQDRDGAARVRPKMAKMLWMRLRRDHNQSLFWTPAQVERLEQVVREVTDDPTAAKRNMRAPTVDDWMVIGRRMEDKDSLQCMEMWERLQASPAVVQDRIQSQAVMQYLWLHGKLPVAEDKAQWEKENPGVPLEVPKRIQLALEQKPSPINGWSPKWDQLLDWTVERYGATVPNFRRLAEILNTTPHDIARARQRMNRRRYGASRRQVKD